MVTIYSKNRYIHITTYSLKSAVASMNFASTYTRAVAIAIYRKYTETFIITCMGPSYIRRT